MTTTTLRAMVAAEQELELKGEEMAEMAIESKRRKKSWFCDLATGELGVTEPGKGRKAAIHSLMAGLASL